MSLRLDSVDALAEQVLATPRASNRRLVALAGAPGSGKSTLAEKLAQVLTTRGAKAQVVPMDGFHLDNRILTALDLLDRKGAPETFDATGFARLMQALGSETPVYYPLFDRTRDIAIAGAGQLEGDCDTVIVEGNYLLLDADHWRSLSAFWDLRVRLDVDLATLRQRLIDRWLDEGLTEHAAIARAEGNDLRNAQLIQSHSLPCDVVFDASGS
ncbi:nucleoside/nucleotide kinase family protein [uncultured Roseobacter sp.]|uniref:nucleoside/nucleotide kinase family protein n=1 Tax=uncultured Roseobacter sp. TaxID=114847 RepID=UPI00261AE653|nr:nucleoside/nucleotide kinase family protein [uncultured Roseobacter sp.]